MKTMPFFLCVVILLLGASLQAEVKSPPKVPLFNNHFLIETSGNNTTWEIVFFVPHFNEKNGARAASEVIKDWKEAGLCVLHPCNSSVEEAMKKDMVVKNDPAERYLYFSSNKQWYSIDPNRIYTSRGIDRELLVYQDLKWVRRAELKEALTTPPEVHAAVAETAAEILEALHLAGVSPRPGAVVAVHNNSPTPPGNLETFSFLWYKEKGPCWNEVERKEGSPCIYEGDPVNMDDLILVNRYEDFLFIKKDGRFNAVLMRAQAEGIEGDDGSLSVYCSNKNIRYINVEAQHMNTPQLNERSLQYQVKMLQLIRQMLEVKTGNNNSIPGGISNCSITIKEK